MAANGNEDNRNDDNIKDRIEKLQNQVRTA